MNPVWKKGAGILLAALLVPAAGAAARDVLPYAAHTALEQSLDGKLQHRQVVFAERGLVVRNQQIKEDGLTLNYPDVRLVGRKDVSRKISRYFMKLADQSRDAYHKANTMDEKLTSTVEYQVRYLGERYLSFQRYGMDYVERAAHPSSWELGTTFDLKTGEPVAWNKIVSGKNKDQFTLKKINAALWNSPYGQENSFFPDFKGLDKLPENYYLDENGNIHFIFQQYEIAPYAAGIIDLDMNAGI